MVIISLKKQQKIDFSNMDITGSILNIKSNVISELDSFLIRDYIYLLEYDIEVNEYCEKPIEMTYIEGYEKKKYIPDFYVNYRNGSREFIEIQHLGVDKKNKIIKEFCSKNKIGFRVLREVDIKTDLLFNAKFLLYYKNPLINISFGEIELLMDTLEKFHKITIITLIEECSQDNIRKAELLYTLWYSISNNFIKYEKNIKLTMNSVIWL